MELTKEGFIKVVASKEILISAASAKIKTVTCDDESVNSRTFCNKNKLPAFMAEVCFGKIFTNFLYKPTFNYDYICGDYTLDVKSKHRSVPPSLNFSATIPKYQVEKQNVTNYCFCSTYLQDKDYVIFFCGKISKWQFLNNARLLKAGYVDKSNNMTFTEDSYEIKYSEMDQWKELPKNE